MTVAAAKAEMDAAFQQMEWNEFRSWKMMYQRLTGSARPEGGGDSSEHTKGLKTKRKDRGYPLFTLMYTKYIDS